MHLKGKHREVLTSLILIINDDNHLYYKLFQRFFFDQWERLNSQIISPFKQPQDGRVWLVPTCLNRRIKYSIYFHIQMKIVVIY